jgi:hypothetical protein
MIAEVIEKGDATFTVKYSAENGAEAMIMGMMATTEREKGVYLNASGEKVHVGGVMLPMITTLLQKFGTA